VDLKHSLTPSQHSKRYFCNIIKTEQAPIQVSVPFNPASSALKMTTGLAQSIRVTGSFPYPGTSKISCLLPVGNSFPVRPPPGFSKQLSRQLLLFFYREGGFKPFKSVRVFLTDKIPLRVFVSAGDAVQKSGGQFSDEKIVRIRVIGLMRALGFGRNKTRLVVKVK